MANCNYHTRKVYVTLESVFYNYNHDLHLLPSQSSLFVMYSSLVSSIEGHSSKSKQVFSVLLYEYHSHCSWYNVWLEHIKEYVRI